MPIIVGPVRIFMGTSTSVWDTIWSLLSMIGYPKHFFLYSNDKLNKQSGSRGEWTWRPENVRFMLMYVKPAHFASLDTSICRFFW